MRILITSDIFPPDAGGPATYVPIIARELAGRGHSVRVLTYSLLGSDRSDTAYPFQVERIIVRGPRLLRLARTFIRIAVHARAAEVLYVNGLLIETALVNLLMHKPTVAKVVGDITWERSRDKGWIADDFEEFQRRQYGWRIELRRALRTWALRRMQAVVVPSAYLQRVVGGWGIDAHRIHVIYNAFEPAADDGTPVVLPLTTPYRLITICRLTAWKGVDGLIEAIAGLPDVGLVVVGDGPERAALEGLSKRLGVAERVYFAGQIPRQRVGAYLRACNLFVLNSRYEGLPHVMLEALAIGLPVVAAETGGISEIVQDGVNGRLVKPGDTDGLRRVITEVLGDADLCARCAADRIQTIRRFTPEVMVNATEQVLKGARRQTPA